jgi:hypothetical protein
VGEVHWKSISLECRYLDSGVLEQEEWRLGTWVELMLLQ